MSFLDRLGEELERAARQQSHARGLRFTRRWSRRTLVFALVAALLVAVPTVAAVTGVFKTGHPHPHPRSQPGLVDVGPRCGGPTPKVRFTTAPAAPELVRILAVLRRPQTSQDRLPHPERFGVLAPSPINPDSVRLAQTSTYGARIYLIPVADVNAEPDVPDTPACARIKPPKRPVVPGLVVYERSANGGGGAGRATAAAIRQGFTLNTSYVEGRDKPGHATAFGLAPDGVSEVTLRYRRDRRWHSIRVPVVGNVFATSFPGHAGQAIRLYFHTAHGVRAVGPLPPSRAARRRQHDLTQRSLARDRAATARPQAFPARGTAHTVFTVRMKVSRPSSDGIYIISISGPKPGDCRHATVLRSGVLAAETGPLRGLVRAAFGYPRSEAGWCAGRYRGTVTLDGNGRRRGGTRSPLGHFVFQVVRNTR